MARPRKSDGSAETSARVAEDAGFEPPFVPGASKPEMKRPKAKPRTSDGKFSIDWFAEMMSALNDYSVDYWNWWGRQWPEYREHVETLLAQAKACGVDLSAYSPETISVTQIASIDEVFALTDSAIDQMTRQIGGAAVRAIDLLPDAKKKSWLSVLRKLRTLQSMCRDRAPSSWTQGMSPEETEAWEHIHPIRFMAYCQRSTMNARPGREEPILIPDHLILACLTRSLAKAAREAGYGIRGAITVIPPRHGKPVHEDSLVLMGDGSRRRIADVLVGDMVISHTGNPRRVLAVHDQGELPLVEIVADSGRITKAAPDHPFLTAGGWVEAGKLSAGMSLALVPTPRTDPTDGRPEEEYRLAGYLVGDGCVVAHNGSHECSIACADPVQIEDIVRCAHAIGFGTKIVGTKGKASVVRIRGAIPWLKGVGLAGKGSWTKRVPEFVYRGSARNIAAYIGAYFACDGTVNRRGGARTDCCVEFYSVSRQLLGDTQHLLLRLGIKSGIRLKNGRMPDNTPHKSFRLSFASVNEVQKFKDIVPVASSKAKRLSEWATNRSDFGSHLLPDMVKSVRDAGAGRCLCLTVDLDSTFTSDDFVVHNSWLMCATRALTMCLDPWSPFAVVHNKDDIASERVSMVKEWFDDDKAIGRRRAALFPRVRLNTRRSRAEGIIFLLHDGKPSNSHAEGNYIGFGIKAAAQGITLREIDFDDPVDERERHEEGSRVRTNHAFHSTWLNRLTGKDSFFTLISTCWHPSDVTGGMLSMARNGTVSAAVCTISCGGPDEDFRPIWPEAGYDARFLRSQYLRLGPVSYACIYQNRPDSSEGRRIGNLSFYDARMVTEPAARTEAWRRFLESPHTKHVLSVDPSGSDKITSNRAGILLSAFGDMECVLPDGTTQRLPRCIALRFWSIRATQHGLVDHVMSLIEAKERIDLILVETTAGYHATPEEMIRRGIPAAKVVRCTPGGTGSKIERLMRYGVHIENGDMAFPGEYTNDEHGDAVLQILPSWERVAEQLLSPDMASDNEMIDVVRQMLGYFAPEFRAAAMHDPETARPVSRDQRALLEYYRNMVRPDRRKDEGRGTIAGFMQEKVGSWTG